VPEGSKLQGCGQCYRALVAAFEHHNKESWVIVDELSDC
jgi:hypothetical protein